MFFLESLLMYLMAFFVSMFMNNSLYAQSAPSPQHVIVQEVHRGHGTEVHEGDKITVFYAAYDSDDNGGSLIDMRRNETAFTFTLGSSEVEDGFNIGILGQGTGFKPMKEGGKRRVFLPESASTLGKDINLDIYVAKIVTQKALLTK